MKFTLQRDEIKKRYKGFLLLPQIGARFIGKVELVEQCGMSEPLLKFLEKWGYIETMPGVVIKKETRFSRIMSKFNDQPYPRQAQLFSKNYFCNRCHTSAASEFIEFRCAKCEQVCVYCRHCIAMGRVATCSTLFRWKMPIKQKRGAIYSGQLLIQKERHQLTWDGTLTPLQQQASQQLATAIQRKKNHVITAVCGAGKTELLFQPIYEALQRGHRVCVATPRTDVVLELYPRFQSAFQKTNIQALYGGAEKSNQFHSLIIATTHQLYKFEHAFDVIIVDEADAFPYTYDQALQRAVEKAKKTGAASALVTATPSSEITKMVERGDVTASFIPKRYHDFPLPVPRTEPLWFYERAIRKGKIPAKLSNWVDEHFAMNRPILLFFPSIQLMEGAYPLFQKMYPDLLMVHADDPDRKEKVMKLRREETRGLLTTTILERGVTIKNVQVAVVGAENKIFDANALIQIAGRVGRNVAFPNGDVVFFHHGVTAEMDLAIEKIKGYNKEAGFA